jgi:hypothetical protein
MINLNHIPQDFRDRVRLSLEERFNGGELVFNFDNDWDLHLYALVLRSQGIKRNDVESMLMGLPLIHIPQRKKEKYVSDILDSIVVGYKNPKEALPVFIQKGGE